jgi:hypothetical protein
MYLSFGCQSSDQIDVGADVTAGWGLGLIFCAQAFNGRQINIAAQIFTRKHLLNISRGLNGCLKIDSILNINIYLHSTILLRIGTKKLNATTTGSINRDLFSGILF